MAYFGSYGNVLNLPETRPSLLLDFANTKSLDPRIDFTRASTATYYDGKTVEKAEENLFTYSQAFNDSIWGISNADSLSFTELAPDGTNTALFFTASSFSNGKANIARTVAGQPTVLLGKVYTVSIFAKAGNYGYIQIMPYLSFSTNQSYANYDLLKGIVSYEGNDAIASISSLNDGWYRCALTFTATATIETDWQFNIISGPLGERNENWTTSGGQTLYFWGAQLEQRDRATVYTPTTTQPITNYIPVLQTAEQDTARFDHDPVTGESLGLLIEEQRTNLLQYNEEFGNPSWAKTRSSITTNTIVAPDGILKGDKWIQNDSEITGTLDQTPTLSDNTVYALSCFLKAGEWNTVRLRIRRKDGNDGAAIFNIETQTFTSISNLVGYDYQDLKNGWYRVWISVNVVSGATSPLVMFLLGDDGNVFATGNGTSGLYIWGAQLEVGAFPTSYIPTLLTYSGRASTATYRAPDGLIRIAQPNEPRYEINSGGGSNLVLESGATNFMLRTESFDDSYWTTSNVNVAYNSEIAPDGTYTADKIVENTENTSHNIFKPIGVTQNANYIASIFVKDAGVGLMTLYSFHATGFASYVVVDLATGTVSDTNASGKIDPIGNGWYRVSMILNNPADSGSTFQIRLNRNGESTYAGDGSSGIYVWGAQLEVGSAATSYIPSVETFTGRASVGTFYDSTGIIRTASSGQARYTYNPSNLNAPPTLLLEPAATNYLPYSTNPVEVSTALNSVLTGNNAIAPNGLTQATLVVANAGNVQHGIGKASTSIPADSTVTLSVYVKKGTHSYARLDTQSISNWTLNAGISVDLDNGTIINSSNTNGKIESVGNGWYRVSITAITNSTGGVSRGIWVWVANENGNSTLNAVGTESIYVWGTTIEVGYGPTSFIPTEAISVTRAADTSTSASGTRAADVYSSSQVTRSSDNASISGENFSTWYANKQGSVYSESAVFNVNTKTQGIWELKGDLAGTSLRSPQATAGRLRANVGNVFSSGTTGAAISPNVFIKATVAWDGLNGRLQSGSIGEDIVASSDLNATLFSVGSLSGGTFLNGHIKKIAYYPVRLSNDTLVEITR